MLRRGVVPFVSIAILVGVCCTVCSLRQRYRRDHESCANCRSFIDSALEQYLMERKDGWLPRGGRTPADSLTQLSPWLKGSGASCFTSHALAGKLHAYYEKHGTFTYDLMCYRYNEGLRENDPTDLIVIYYFKPTRWECSYHKKSVLGRPVMGLGSFWEFLPEEEFQKRQKRTEDYLRENDRVTISATPPAGGVTSDGQLSVHQ